MSDALVMSREIGAGMARLGWFYGVNRLLERQARRLGQARRYKPRRPVPQHQELLVAVAELMLADAERVRCAECPPTEHDPATLGESWARLREMFADMPEALSRRASEEAQSVRSEPAAADLPAYYVQDFHFQTGGYLSEVSARLYDVQVETLFYGAANAMRRAALPFIVREVRGRDQRRMALLDVACGTGRFLRDVRLMWPAMQLSGLDLSAAYLAEARRHMGRLRPVSFIEGNAEAIPLPDASQDFVTAVFLFHELPAEVRRTVAAEIARVLKPGGLLVLVDSLQMGDRPGWDGLIEAFPVRFHEPYFRGYAVEDLDRLLSTAGLVAEAQSLAFLSKILVRRKAS